MADRHAGALAGIGNGDGPANAGIAPCDQGLAPLKPAKALVAFLAMISTRLHLFDEAGLFLRLFREWRLGILGPWVAHFILVQGRVCHRSLLCWLSKGIPDPANRSVLRGFCWRRAIRVFRNDALDGPAIPR